MGHRSVHCAYLPVSVLSGIMLETIYASTSFSLGQTTVRIKRVSVKRGSTVLRITHLKGLLTFSYSRIKTMKLVEGNGKLK